MSEQKAENINEKSERGIPNPLKRLFTLPESGVYLGRPVAGIRAMIYRGELPRGIQYGPRGKIWLLREDLDRWVEEHVKPLAFDKPARSRDGRGRFEGQNGVSDER